MTLEGGAMPTYVSLINWTDKGVAAFKETVDRAEAGMQLAGRFGGSLKETYWTIGPVRHHRRLGGAGRRERDGIRSRARLAGQRPDDDAPRVRRRRDARHHRKTG
jgi:hypothetical protein